MPYEYHYPYPTAEALATHPFVQLQFDRLDEAEMLRRGEDFLTHMQHRRSVRMLSNEPVPRRLVELAIEAASTAPSGAHRQPWTFVVVGDPGLKRRIREAAEAEERQNYDGGRMNEEWRHALGPLGTDSHKEFLEVAPWLVVLFEQRFSPDGRGGQRHNYYVKESVGIAAGIFITALHTMGLVTLTHTPSPMAFLSKVLDRPEHERPFVVFPIGYPLEGTLVPDLRRKSLLEVMVEAAPG